MGIFSFLNRDQDLAEYIPAPVTPALEETGPSLPEMCREMPIEVVEKSGWCAEDPKKKTALLKKLKGDYKKDKKAVLDALNMQENEINIDEELYLIYQIQNWKLILAFFEEATFEKTAESIKRCILVDETVKIGLRAG